ncbi:hypothetical protein B0H14DRAFT_3863626 [Mycena olivaceomarginata]|nr:hypothetical protein B0H14DRAFT_3863626 [Mycena olivaceomarginata]
MSSARRPFVQPPPPQSASRAAKGTRGGAAAFPKAQTREVTAGAQCAFCAAASVPICTPLPFPPRISLGCAAIPTSGADGLDSAVGV